MSLWKGSENKVSKLESKKVDELAKKEKKEQYISNYVRDIYADNVASMVYRKFGSSLSDKDREEKVNEQIEKIRLSNVRVFEQTQEIFDEIKFNAYMPVTVNGKSCYKLMKIGHFRKVHVCYFISKAKNDLSAEFLEQILSEVQRQHDGENVFGSPDYKEA